MSYVPGAMPSPRIEFGTIKWYRGDTFDVNFYMELEDQDGVSVEIQPADVVEVMFLDARHEKVKSFVFENVTNNCLNLVFDRDTTALFSGGRYTYDIYLNGERRVTLVNNNEVIVEC